MKLLREEGHGWPGEEGGGEGEEVEPGDVRVERQEGEEEGGEGEAGQQQLEEQLEGVEQGGGQHGGLRQGGEPGGDGDDGVVALVMEYWWRG